MSNVLTHAVVETVSLGRKAEGKTFHIALTGTADYIPHMGVVILSAAKSNPEMSITYHVFVNRLSEEEKARLAEAADIAGSDIQVHLIDDRCFASLLLSDGVAAFFYRFLVPPAMDGVADRVLYLDGDMMVRGSLQYLAELDLTGYAAAVVTDRKEQLQMDRVHTAHYFNAGMMLINVDEWKKENFFDDIVRRAQDNVKKVGKRLSHHDQDIHNQMLDGRTLYIDRKYNYLYNLDRQSAFKKQPVNDDWEKQVIIHFAGHAKPWHSWVQEWPVVRAYAALQQASPWRDCPVVPPKGSKNLHQAARTARMYGRWGEMLKWYGKYLASKL